MEKNDNNDKYRPNISIVIPLYNEEKAIPTLYEELKRVLQKLGEHEIIFVDDGSTDRTYDILQQIHDRDKSVRVIKFRKNFGQTATLSIGFENSRRRDHKHGWQPAKRPHGYPKTFRENWRRTQRSHWLAA